MSVLVIILCLLAAGAVGFVIGHFMGYEIGHFDGRNYDPED